MTKHIVTVALASVFTVFLSVQSAAGDEDPDVDISDIGAEASVEEHHVTPGASPGLLKGARTGGAPALPSGRALSANIVSTDIKGAKPKDKVQVKYDDCDNSMSECTGTRAGCSTLSGNPNYFQPPTVTYVSVNDGAWEPTRLSCGVPDSVTIDQGPGQPPLVVPIQAPPVPTLGQIQTAFKQLPFSKPSVTVQPVGMKTLKNLKTFYAANWPDNTDLQPGDTSQPVKLLSWTIEFTVDAQDYRYDFGDGTHSNWTTSTGGTYPDGDITHTYTDTGTVNIKVDARLTGRYRVNGGTWQDIATTADLQDEPTDTLTIVGTKTRLTTEG
ncbi:hypothetical protein [Janibacter limosus]|uniref:hypothetical protein n=1 Tax=Janibacter limosus TaxID=53458 RepID=UPI00083507B6|nr:hypothetical protein [Janibacter limosus]